MNKLKQLSENIQEIWGKMERESRNAFNDALKEVFEELPWLEALRWEQYTPYFNDGDPCNFMVGEFTLILGDTAPRVLKDHFEVYRADAFGEICLPWNNKTLRAEADVLLAPIDALFAVKDELFEAAFGNHVRVTAKRLGGETINVTVDTYTDHD